MTDLRIIKGFTGYDLSAVQLLEHRLSAYTKPQAKVEEISVSDEGLIEVLLCVYSYKLMPLEGRIVVIATPTKRLTSEVFFNLLQ